MRRTLIRAIRAWRWLWGHICEVVGLLACLLLILFFLPLVPVFKAFEDIDEALKDD